MIRWIVGYMGTGKTTLSALLGQTLHIRVLDTDDMISTMTQMAIHELIARAGMEEFRKLERDLCQNVAGEMEGKRRDVIVSTGGGLPVYSGFSIDEMQRSGPVLALTGDPKDLWKRVGGDPNRPLAQNRDEFISEYEKRMEVYRSADLVIDIETMNTSMPAIIRLFLG